MLPSKIWGTMRVQKAAEKSINTYNGQNKKGFGPYDHQPRKSLHTAISLRDGPKTTRCCDSLMLNITVAILHVA